MRLVHTKLNKPSSKKTILLLNIQRWCFLCSCFVSHVCLSRFFVCYSQPCSFQLGDDWPLSSFVCYLVFLFTFPYVVIGQVRCLIISNIFTDRSKAVLPLWIIMLSLSCYRYACMHVCLLVPCGHLLGKGWPLCSRLWCLTVKLSLCHWSPGSVVVLGSFDSWSVPFSYFK